MVVLGFEKLPISELLSARAAALMVFELQTWYLLVLLVGGYKHLLVSDRVSEQSKRSYVLNPKL